MTAPTIEVGVALGLAEDGDFIIGDPVRGVIGSTDYVLSAGYNSVTTDGYSISISRGRWSRLWDAVDAGNASINLWNMDRRFDPAYLASPFAGYIVPGRKVRVEAAGVTVWSGFVDDWNLEYDVSTLSTATLVSTDALGALGQVQFDAWTSAGISAESKLNDLCDRPEVAWSASLRDFDAGVETLQADEVTWGSNVLNYGQLIARSELGYLFAAADGTLTFRNRQVAVGVSPAVSFGAGGIPYQGISATVGSDVLFSHVGVDREGGTKQTASVADTAAWMDTYGPFRSLSITGLLLDDDAQSLALAEYLLSLYDSNRYRISELVVYVHALETSDQEAVLGLDITSMIDVAFTPNGVGDPITQNLMVQGIRDDISVDTYVRTFSLIEAPFPYFRIGDAEYGVIGVNQLGF